MHRKLLVFPGMVLAAGLTAGTANAQGYKVDNCSQIPKGAQPAPIGTYLNRFIEIQDANAEADDFVIYKHMWFRGGKELGPLGKYQLDLIAKRLSSVPFPVVIATSKDESLDDARREAITSMLAARGFADATRVIVAYPTAEGLYGDEAEQIYRGIISLRNTSNRFNSSGNFNDNQNYSGFGGFGGFGGQGFGNLGRGF